MNNKYIPIFLVLFFTSCTRDVTTISVVRNPLISAKIDTVNWAVNEYTFLPTTRVVEYPADTNLPARLYNRYTLQASGKDSRGNNLQLTIVFDATDNQQLTGIYRPKYTASRGLYTVQLYNLDNDRRASYTLCDTATSFFEIRKQSITDRLIAGSFSAVLCNDRSPANRLNITNGIINDINYRN